MNILTTPLALLVRLSSWVYILTEHFQWRNRLSEAGWLLHKQGMSRGGTDLERGYGDVRPWRPPFHASPAARKGPISSKRVGSQDPLLRKFGNFSLNSLNFHPNFSSQAPKFGNFQLTSPQIWKFSAHEPPNLEIFRSQAPLFRGKCQFPSPTLWKSGLHTPTWKKLSAPPPPGMSEGCATLMVCFFTRNWLTTCNSH